MGDVLKLILIFFLLTGNVLYSQTIQGRVTSGDQAVPFANIIVEGLEIGVSADESGKYIIKNIPLGSFNIIASAVGMISKKSYNNIDRGLNIINIDLESTVYNLEQVVVTGTRTFKKRTESPVIVNVMDSRQLQNVQACNLAEGLTFQSGIRVETDCQTCNYTQLRMNGLAGGYSQILINGRPILSPLTGLYAMEQVPANMIDKIEVVRGGGSSLYGSSAIAGIVNVITKIPATNYYSLGYNYALINSVADDKVFHGNVSVLSESKKSAITFFLNSRDRMWYDYNGDNYSELPAIKGNAFGASFFVLPSVNQKLEINMSSLYEYRYGGEMVLGAPHFSMQAEERIHNVLLGNMDYEFNFNEGASSFVAYLAAQQTERDHYTGVRPDIDTDEDQSHLSNPPYGFSLNTTKQAGLQLSHKVDKWLGVNLVTVGSEYVLDDVMDKILAYGYLVDRKVANLGVFVQSDWNLNERFNILSGARFDKHSMLDNTVFSPRFSLLYNARKNMQFRMSYSTGFRAPQAFDADLHIAFAGGGVSRIVLDDKLEEERSNSLSASFNYDKATKNYIYGFTLEGFYTRLDNAFYQDPAGSDEFGEVFVKRNGPGAKVKGVTMEFRANLKKKLQIESGITFQSSCYDNAIAYSSDLPPKQEFLRSPKRYGYATLVYDFSGKMRVSGNLVHTGVMDLVHLAGSPSQEKDEFFQSPVFNAIGLKLAYIQRMSGLGVQLIYSCGVKNITNSYQQEFDSLKYRDSNFVYGPSLPRTIYFGIVLKSL